MNTTEQNGHQWTEAPVLIQSRLNEHHGDAVDARTSVPAMPKFLAECLASALRGNRQMVTGFTGNSNLTYSVAVSPIYKTPQQVTTKQNQRLKLKKVFHKQSSGTKIVSHNTVIQSIHVNRKTSSHSLQLKIPL